MPIWGSKRNVVPDFSPGTSGRFGQKASIELPALRRYWKRETVSEEKKSGWSLGMWLLFGILVLLVMGALAPMFYGHRGRHNSDPREAVHNARQLGLALFEFETEYGSFPDETTATKVRQKTGTRLLLGNTSSNDYFRQLVAAEIVSNDRLFYAKTAFSKKSAGSEKPSDWILDPGTVGFGYLMNGKSAFTSVGNPGRPLACAPLAFDGKSVSSQQFEFNRYDGKVVVLRIDNSVASLPIQKDTRLAILGGGKTLLQTGLDTVWSSTEHPVIVPPLPKP